MTCGLADGPDAVLLGYTPLIGYPEVMGALSVEAIKDAIAGLPEQEKAALAAWLNAQTMDEWDSEMQRDFSPGGRGQHLVEKVKAEVRAGHFRPMPERKPRE